MTGETSPSGRAPDPTLVELRGVTHRFGDVTALDDLSLEVPRARITVLLGPNGAGKTTAIRAVTGALSPRTGEISVFGVDPRVHGDKVRPRCGVVSAKPALYDRLTGRDNLHYSAKLYGVDGADVDERILAAATRFGIEDALGHHVGGYSTGMKTRLALARSVLHDPDLLLFDEPTSGLDPESAQAVLELIREMTGDGHTVVMCTHLLAEAEGLADHIVVMEAGTAIVAGAPAEMARRFWPGQILRLAAETPRELDRVANYHGVLAYARRDDGVAEVAVDGWVRIPDIVAFLVADGVRITMVAPHQPSLEDLYFAVRREARGEGLAPVAHGGSAGEAPGATPIEPEAAVR